MKRIQILKHRTKAYAKYVIKKLIVLCYGTDLLAINAKQDISIVSFDVYDTAIRRTVKKPEDIFDLVQEQYRIYHEWRLPETFRELRIIAEREARRKSSTGEVQIQEIYNYLEGLNDDEKNWLLEIEIATEKQVAYCNAEFKTVYENLIEQGKDIIFISDMYLPENVIREVLKSCGIAVFKSVYVSCEYNVSKKNGKLFDEVLNDIGVSARSIVHIGDNPWGDFIIPRTKGIISFLYRGME